MAITLKDTVHLGNSIEFSVLYHMKDADEGSRLVIRFFSDGNLAQELAFGWTNLVLQSFIDLLKQFPLEKYAGHFSHYEKHVELFWEFDPFSETYHLTFDLLTDDESTISLVTTQKDIQAFGVAFEDELRCAASLEEYLGNL